MSVNSRVIAAVRARPWAVAIVAVGIIIAAVPFTNATHLGPGADIRFDASLWTSASFDGTYVGQQNVQTQGGNVTRATPYNLLFTSIAAANQTRVELHSPTGVLVSSTDLAVGPDGPGGSLRNATFLISSGTMATTGLYRVTYMGGNGTVGALFVHPTRDITVTASPSTIEYAANTSMVMTISTGVATSTLRGQNIPQPATTDANGNFTFLAPIPPAGTYTVEAWKDLGGDSLPERIGTGTYTVTASQPSLMVTVFPSIIPVDTFVNVTVSVEDGYGNPKTNAHVEIQRPDGSPATSDDFLGTRAIDGTGSPGFGHNGTYSFTLRALRDGDYRVSATAGPSTGSAPLTASSPPPPPPCPNCPPQPPPCAESQCAYNFRIWDVRASSLVPTIAPIRMGNMTNFGSATLTLSYDPSVVEVTNVTNGNVPNSTLTWSVNESRGRVTLLLTTTARPGTSGEHDFARVSFRAVGALGSTSALDLNVEEVVDSDGIAFSTPPMVGDATFRAGLLGDADGDGDIDAQDAIAIAEAVVGRRAIGSLVASSADVSGDGRVTGRDAMLIRQFLAGTRASL